IVKIGPMRYAKIASIEDFYSRNPDNKLKGEKVPVITMEGDLQLLSPNQVITVRNIDNEINSFSKKVQIALDFLKNE
ncbi:hypothetical protein JW868_01900, partial [Candidatus Woesearchaeota archaeon]|nr:hypothetical protein [Candidatus Woesearchaeota archaeon]